MNRANKNIEDKLLIVSGWAIIMLLFTATVALTVWLGKTNNLEVASSEPATSKQNGIKIAAVGDISCAFGEKVSTNNCQMAKVVEGIIAERPEHVLVLGDLQYDIGSKEAFESLFAPLWAPLKEISYATPGNHEYGTKNANGYFNYWNGLNSTSSQAGETGKGYYSVNIGMWHVLSMNSNCEEVGGCDAISDQGRWLVDDLAANSARCTLAFWHHPRFTSGRHKDATNTSYFWDVLYADGTDVVLNGHDHLYERFAKQTPAGVAKTNGGIREFVAGAGGRSLYNFQTSLDANHEYGNDTEFGYLVMTLFDTGYSWEYKTISGTTIDQGSSSCSL